MTQPINFSYFSKIEEGNRGPQQLDGDFFDLNFEVTELTNSGLGQNELGKTSIACTVTHWSDCTCRCMDFKN